MQLQKQSKLPCTKASLAHAPARLWRRPYHRSLCLLPLAVLSILLTCGPADNSPLRSCSLVSSFPSPLSRAALCPHCEQVHRRTKAGPSLPSQREMAMGLHLPSEVYNWKNKTFDKGNIGPWHWLSPETSVRRACTPETALSIPAMSGWWQICDGATSYLSQRHVL